MFLLIFFTSFARRWRSFIVFWILRFNIINNIDFLILFRVIFNLMIFFIINKTFIFIIDKFDKIIKSFYIRSCVRINIIAKIVAIIFAIFFRIISISMIWILII